MMKDFDPRDFELGGTVLLEASAGTGKTFALTTLYLRLLVEKDLLPAQILVVTYTQAATAELRERVRERIREAIEAGEAELSAAGDFDDSLREIGLAARRRAESGKGPDPLRRALQNFDEAAIFTIHGFCQRTLQQNAFESGVAFDAELIESAELLEQTLARDLWARGMADLDSAFVEWLLEGAGRRWQFEPEALKSGLLKLLGADERMPVFPLTAEFSEVSLDTQTLRANLDGAWTRWAVAWRERRDEVVPWLLETPDLNRNSYRRATLEKTWIPNLDAWSEAIVRATAGHAGMPSSLPKWWGKLTPVGLAAGVKQAGVPLEDPVFEAFEPLEDLANGLEEAYGARALAMRRAFVDRAREEAKRRRDQRHQLVFDDLLSELRGALLAPEGDRLVEQLRDQYPFALIDEFQDTDPVQYEIFRRVWHRESDEQLDHGLILIGDPKQAIYSFRGADLFTYLSARRDAEDSAYSLGVNWRSIPGLIHALNELFERPTNVFGFDGIEFRPVRPKPTPDEPIGGESRSSAGLRFLVADYDRAMAARVDLEGEERDATKKPSKRELPLRFGRSELMDAFARDVADLLESDASIDGRPVRPSDIAVLCRRKAELVRARRCLEALGIPCVDRGDADVFETPEAWELLCVLRAMLRSGDPHLLRAALATAAIGWDAERLGALDDDSAELAEISERYADYGRVWRQSGFMRAFESWRRSEAVTKRLLAYLDGERRLTNWLHLAELLQKVASDRSPSGSGLANWLERAIADPDARKLLGSDASLLRLESDDQAVSLITLHGSKGLEYEVVYLPCLWEDESPRGPSEQSARADVKRKPAVRCYDEEEGQRVLDLGGPHYAEHVARQREETLSESLRLLYVGLTRAKRQCVVTWGAIGDKGQYASTALAWLLAARGLEVEGVARANAAEKIREWGDVEWREALDALSRAAGPGAVSIESADWSKRVRWQASSKALPELHFTMRARSMPAALTTTSFSGLVRGAYRSLANSIGPVVLGRDLDAEVERVSFEKQVESPDLAAGMALFPRGAEAGTLLHEILEKVDFSNWDEKVVRSWGSAALAEHGLSSSQQDQIVHVVRSVASTPLRLPPNLLRLADLAPGQLRAEMEFTLAAPGGADSVGLTPLSLSKLLAGAAPDSPLQCYAERVSRLGWREFQGYLRGFIDAVFFDGERYYLIDYKSNYLGARQSDYMPENLLAPMIEHDYVLQYLIYSVALDRHLERTHSGYDFEKHFGGAYYLFLRGMAEEHAPGCGVFFDRPDSGLVRAVSALLGAGRMEQR